MIDTTLKNANILIVDDQDSNIDILTYFLEMEGYSNIQTTTDPREVDSLVESFSPDLILLDLSMPYLSGFEVMEKLKKLVPSTSLIPILVLTADITIEAKQKALSGGASDFLSKPFDLMEVGLRIKNLLFTKYLLQQYQNQNRFLEEKVKERTNELQKLNAELELRVDERTAELEAANKELETFAYQVSHDLKAPLRHINGYVEMLMETNSNRTEEETRFMNTIAKGAVEMDKIIEALLSFSRFTRAALQKTNINCSKMVGEVVTIFDREIKYRNIVIKIGQINNCEGDEQLIKQVWINLISNAIKYTGKKPDATIEIGSDQQENEIIYFVKDNGAGFDMNHAAKLFGMFQRAHKSSDFEGNGIGLATVKSIVTRHGGHCHAEGEEGKGATFYFSLPGRH